MKVTRIAPISVMRNAGVHDPFAPDPVGEPAERDGEGEHARGVEHVREHDRGQREAVMGEHQRGQHHDDRHVALAGAVGQRPQAASA